LVLARDVLGAIDLDPASSVEAQAVIGARRFFTIEQDGLSQRWRGRLWLNVPYSRPGPWVDKLVASYQTGQVSAAVALFNSMTGARWFDTLARCGWRCELRKRIAFWGPATAGGPGMRDQVFFYLGRKPERFASVFGEHGRIVAPSVTLGVTRGAVCSVCSRSLAGLRSGAVVCSSRCRQRAYRVRVAG
jgi:hypothetical protein